MEFGVWESQNQYLKEEKSRERRDLPSGYNKRYFFRKILHFFAIF